MEYKDNFGRQLEVGQQCIYIQRGFNSPDRTYPVEIVGLENGKAKIKYLLEDKSSTIKLGNLIILEKLDIPAMV